MTEIPAILIERGFEFKSTKNLTERTTTMEKQIHDPDHQQQSYSRSYQDEGSIVQFSVSLTPGVSKEEAVSNFAQMSHRFYLDLAEELNNKP
jgi:hypothetical protein